MAVDSRQENKGVNGNMLESALPKGTKLVSKSREYRVTDVLGAGGFGITYKVSSRIRVGNVELETFFAVKEFFVKGCYRGENKMQVLCAPTARQDFEEGQRDFKTEAERLNKLGRMSENIVKVNEIFFANGTVYYVMEYLEGGDLVHCIRENNNLPLTEARAISIMLPIIRAVEQIHKEGLLHLDIKPDNIVLKKTSENEAVVPVLIDFGLAKHFDHNGRPTSRLVAKGASDGYAPMEQYTDIDSFAPEIDVYALGATLYYLLTAKNPPKAFDIHSVSDLLADIPEKVSERTKKVIAGAMQKSKFDRIPNVKTLMRDMEKSYTLPVGYVLHGQRADYRIVDIVGETDYSITYKAILSHSLNDNSQESVTGGNSTRVAVHYLVREYYYKKRDERRDDGSVFVSIVSWDTTKKEIDSRFRQEVEQVVPSEFLDHFDEQGHLLAERFEANGTVYYSCIVRPKKVSEGKDVLENVMKRVGASKKFILVGVLSFLVVYGVIALVNPEPREAVESVDIPLAQMVQEAFAKKDKNRLLILARDSASNEAYYSLAKLYFEEGDSDNALKYAEEGLDSANYFEIHPFITKVVGQKIKVLNHQLDKEVQSLSSDATERVEQLVKARKIQESIANLAKTHAVSYTENARLKKQIDADFEKWKKAGDSNPINSVKINCYEIALKLKWETGVQRKLDELTGGGIVDSAAVAE